MNESNGTPAAPASSAASSAKTNAMLAWIFAPFTSFAWKDDSDEFVKAHARESLYVGIAQLAVVLVVYIVQAILFAIFFSGLSFGMLGIFGLFGLLFNLIWLATFAFMIVPRIIGVMKANEGQKWEFPQVTNLVKKYIKL